MASTMSRDEAELAQINDQIKVMSTIAAFLTKYNGITNAHPLVSREWVRDESGSPVRDENGAVVWRDRTPPPALGELEYAISFAKLLVRYPKEVVAVAISFTNDGLDIITCATGAKTETYPARVTDKVVKIFRRSNGPERHFILPNSYMPIDPRRQTPQEERLSFRGYTAVVAKLIQGLVQNEGSDKERQLVTSSVFLMAFPAIAYRITAGAQVLKAFQSLGSYILYRTEDVIALTQIPDPHGPGVDAAIRYLSQHGMSQLGVVATWDLEVAKAMYKTLCIVVAQIHHEGLGLGRGGPIPPATAFFPSQSLFATLDGFEWTQEELSPLIGTFFHMCGRLMYKDYAVSKNTDFGEAIRHEAAVGLTRDGMDIVAVRFCDSQIPLDRDESDHEDVDGADYGRIRMAQRNKRYSLLLRGHATRTIDAKPAAASIDKVMSVNVAETLQAMLQKHGIDNGSYRSFSWQCRHLLELLTDSGENNVKKNWIKYSESVSCDAHAEAVVAVWAREKGFLTRPLATCVCAVSKHCCMVCRMISRELLRKQHEHGNCAKFDDEVDPEYLPLVPVALPEDCPLDVARKVLREVEVRFVDMIKQRAFTFETIPILDDSF